MRLSLLCASVLGLSLLRPIMGDEPAQPAPSPNSAISADEMQKARETFREKLSGSVLAGYFTIDSDKADQPLKKDRYEIATVNPVRDDYWLFVYMHKGVPIPLQLKVLWAGKTPVLTLDDFTIAGMGTFSARVMFHGDRYAGTWQHGEKGGLMFGLIEKPGKNEKPGTNGAAKPSPAEPEKKAEASPGQ